MKFTNWIKQKDNKQTMTVLIALIALVGAVGFANAANSNTSSTASQPNVAVATDHNDHQDEYKIPELSSGAATTATSTQTKDSLLYLIEEEKLAHDVYVAMYAKYGSRMYDNIQKSETSHQNLVASLLTNRSIADPRSDTLGVFVNQDLQKLYNDLVAQGSKSITGAYKVGVIIEEMDIADLKQDIAALDASETDVKSVLDTLLRGSENHLRAFSRKLG